jgi:hypothetical protein
VDAPAAAAVAPAHGRRLRGRGPLEYRADAAEPIGHSPPRRDHRRRARRARRRPRASDGLRERGYTDGRSIVVERRYADGRPERINELAAELVRMRADVIVTGTDAAIAAVERQTRSIPIVMVAASDPVGTGFVASLARPGGNVTGSSRMSSELGAKRLELLREAVPQLSRVAVVTPNPVTFANQDQVPGFARRQRRPSIYGVHEYVDAGVSWPTEPASAPRIAARPSSWTGS